jgi:streptogramin lyase
VQTHLSLAKKFQAATILALTAAVMVMGPQTLPAQSSTVSGVVKDSAGQPVAGAFVRVRSADLGLTFLVVSQAQGRYRTPNLLPGQYTVEGIGGEYQSAGAGPVEVRGGQQANLDVTLSARRKPVVHRKQMTSDDYKALMPEGEAKTLLASRCVLCHGLERVVPTRKSREGWEETVTTMGFYLMDHNIRLTDREKGVMVDYLAANYGPSVPRLRDEANSDPDPNRHLPRTLLQGAEAKYVVMEFRLQKDVEPHDIAVDAEGIAWVSERTGHVGRYDPKALTYTRYQAPKGEHPDQLNAIAVDPRGHVWAMDNGRNTRMVHFDPKSREFNTYPMPPPPPPSSGTSSINTIRFLDGKVWGSGITSSRIVELDPVTRKMKEYPVPKGSHPYGLAIGGGNSVWYVGNYSDELVKLDPKTGELSRYKVPTSKSDLRRMAADAEGNLWAGAHEAGVVVKVDYRTGKMTEYRTPTTNSGPYSVDVDTTRNLVWTGEHYGDKLGRFDPKTSTWADFSLPSVDTDMRRIEIDRSNPNRVWWSGSGADLIGYVEVLE